MKTRSYRQSELAFTLIELMIVVALIGALASLAVPSFRTYQMKAKRSEAFGNLASLAQMQKTYFAEFGSFVGTAPEPSSTTAQNPTSIKRSVAPVSAAFSTLGWTPEGDVFFDYDSRVPGFGNCTCSACFTATAYGDLDASGSLSEITYFHPGADGGFCTVGVSDNSPPQNADNENIWDSPVHHPLSDFF